VSTSANDSVEDSSVLALPPIDEEDSRGPDNLKIDVNNPPKLLPAPKNELVKLPTIGVKALNAGLIIACNNPFAVTGFGDSILWSMFICKFLLSNRLISLVDASITRSIP
jgi:hypothetical protein